MGDVAKITMGQSPNSNNYTSNPKDYILVQGNADMKNGQVHPRVWTTEVTKTASKGDLILSVRAPVGDVGKTGYDVVIGRGVAAIQGNEFIYQLLRQMKAAGYWTRFSTGSTFESINSFEIHNAVINLPDKHEQIEIGKLLLSFDRIITLHEEKKCQLERLKSALLQKMFADKSGYPTVRFVGFENAWEQCKLGDVFVESTEKSKDDNEELLSVTLKDGVIKAKSLDRKNNASFDKKNYKLVIPNDIAYNSMRMWQGALGVSKYRGIVSPAYTVIKLRNQLENPYFYQYYFKKSETLNLFRKNSQGLTSDTWNLKYPLFSRIHFFTTSIEEQQKISSLLNLLDCTITLHDHKLELLKRMKQSLLQKMFI